MCPSAAVYPIGKPNCRAFTIEYQAQFDTNNATYGYQVIFCWVMNEQKQRTCSQISFEYGTGEIASTSISDSL